MRLPVDVSARHARRYALVLILVPALTGCGSHDTLASAASGAAATTGPAADYPMVISEPYRIGAALYTPSDTMNYDEVGYAAADSGTGVTGVTGSHHTLPLPSYVEVTSLATGKTILVRLARRGPMDGDAVVALAPAAFAQLGASVGEAVRVRRVNPPEEERASLRAGWAAPARMDTPMSLVAVLKRKLPGEGSAALTPKASALPAAATTVAIVPSSAVSKQVLRPGTLALSEPISRSGPPPLPPLPARVVAASGSTPVVVARLEQPQPAGAATAPVPALPANQHASYVVQAATMSTRDRAQKVAGAIDGSIIQSGRYFRVRTGPFASREQAQASLAKVRAAGYSDARISTNG